MFSGSWADAEELRRVYTRRTGGIGGTKFTLTEIRSELRAGMKEFKNGLTMSGRKTKHDVHSLVCGFIEGLPVIIYIDHEEIPRVIPDYCAIGCGAENAHAILAWRHKHDLIDPFSNLHDMMYRTYEAKRFGELSSDVGEKTEMIVVSKPPLNSGHLHLKFISPDTLGYLALRFREFGPQSLSDKRYQFPDIPNVISDSGGHSGSNS
jgi:hypothetical protein